MRLYLVQHAAATSKEQNNTRPLTAQGREDITRTSGFLSLFERPKPHRVIHSNRLRSQQTAHMLAEAWSCQHIEENNDMSPQSDPYIWVKNLLEIHEDMVLVGHLPHLQRLAGILLCEDDTQDIIQFKHAGLSCLERSNHKWSLCWQIHPQLFYR